jgi:hypothetical protein
MSRNGNDDSWIAVAIVLVIAVCALAVWQFSTTFGLDMRTGASVLVGLVLLAVATGICWKFGDDFPLPVDLATVWPILLGLLWVCWWPALDYWAAQQYPSFFQSDVVDVWWSAWYTKLGGLIALIGGGFGLKFWRREY